MCRADQPKEYTGWQAVDPCASLQGALRRGDIGREDVASFYSSLNAYVRFFYEDEESGWGQTPFTQFKYPVSRSILTKRCGQLEDNEDWLDISASYRDQDRDQAEVLANFNLCRGLVKHVPPSDYQASSFRWLEYGEEGLEEKNFDVTFELKHPRNRMIGETLTIEVLISNNSSEKRLIHSAICARSIFYTGSTGPCLKRYSTQLTLEPQQQETVTMDLDSWNYEHKVVGMSFVKITTTGFVQQNDQSFVDEIDFRFDKPLLNIQADEMKISQENEAVFSFKNPLDVPLTECYITMEISGSVRPRTIRINREVRPREMLVYNHCFVPRGAGLRSIVACFTSRQLADVVGHKSVIIEE